MLREMLHAFVEYKKISVVFAVAVVLMVFGWIMAARSIRRMWGISLRRSSAASSLGWTR